jgi:hypothetical protein
MSLDFAVLGHNGAPEKTVPLSVELHQELVTAAARAGLSRFKKFEEYYEDAEILVTDLPDLAEQVTTLRIQTDSTDLQHFLDGLSDLIAYAMANGKTLHAIAD